MIDFIESWLERYGVNGRFTTELSAVIAMMGVLLLCLIVDFLTKKVVLKILKAYIERSVNKWDDILWDNGVFARLALIAPAIVLYLAAPAFRKFQGLIQRIVFAYIVLAIILILSSILDAVEDIYWKFEVSKTKPIKGYLQVVQMVIWIVGIVIMVSVIVDRSPVILLSGIGAATAVLLLIFQNSILGLVSSIQLSANDMLKIGDWISMPSHDADGEVLDISLHTVKIQNFDKSIVTVPTYKMTSESFVNWQGMINSGGRRIKRYIYIDISSVAFCTEEMLAKYEKIDYLKHYLAVKKNDIRNFNKENNINTQSMVNGRHLTNVGTFRAYVEAYIQNHPSINKNMLHMVRQLQPSEKGLPIEIYAFTNGTAWEDYENAQADILDHILAIVAEFDLRVYQAPAGYDLRKKNISEANLVKKGE